MIEALAILITIVCAVGVGIIIGGSVRSIGIIIEELTSTLRYIRLTRTLLLSSDSERSEESDREEET